MDHVRNLPLIFEFIPSKHRSQMIDITPLVARCASHHQIDNGMVIVFVPHTTAAVTINENADPDVQHDLLQKLETLIPRREAFYQHDEGNSDSHVKTSLVGNSATVLVEKGELALGRWQAIYLCEFDGPRQRSVMIKLVDFET